MYLCPLATVGVVGDFTNFCGNTHEEKGERENELHSSSVG
jgi:hypothetical protein